MRSGGFDWHAVGDGFVDNPVEGSCSLDYGLDDGEYTSQIAAALATGIVKLLVVGRGIRLLPFAVATVLAWTVYVAVRCRTDLRACQRWGWSTQDLAPALRLVAPALVASGALFVGFGLLRNTLLVTWRLPLILAVYPLWGAVQQFLVVAMFATNVDRLTGYRLPRWGLVTLAALLFAAVHVPSLPLVLATFALGIVATSIYLRFPNLWALGLLHGWYATMLYFFVLETAPLV